MSKEELIDALGKRERRRFNTAMDEAMSGVVGVARLEAAVDVIATFVENQPPGRLLDLEPTFAHEQMAQALPMITEGLMQVLQRCDRENALASAVDPRDLAGACARTALSHYIFPTLTTPRRAARSAPPPVSPPGLDLSPVGSARQRAVIDARQLVQLELVGAERFRRPTGSSATSGSTPFKKMSARGSLILASPRPERVLRGSNGVGRRWWVGRQPASRYRLLPPVPSTFRAACRSLA